MEVDGGVELPARLVGGGGGVFDSLGVRVGVVCLCTVKGQIYVQSALNQMRIPSLTQHTQKHKTCTHMNPDCALECRPTYALTLY